MPTLHRGADGFRQDPGGFPRRNRPLLPGRQSTGERGGTEVVYVSPLRALTVDVSENLRKPLAEIEQVAGELGLEPPHVQVAVRNGDTPPSERSAMLRNRPEIVVTTPESLYLLLTSAKGREMLAGVRTVIVDEIHALAHDKRGSHLALSLERLDRLVTMAGGGRPVRIGLSATQRPISTIARLLVGAGPERTLPGGEPLCTVVDVGHQAPPRCRHRACPTTSSEPCRRSTRWPLSSSASRPTSTQHRTTLVFVNTRRMAERVAHQLADRLGEDCVQAHHGSLSMDRRLRVEGRLRAGELHAVVATASLELGIDVGPVELVCQIGSPRQHRHVPPACRRAQHHVGGDPKWSSLSRSPATSSSSARRCSPRYAPVTSTPFSPPSPPSTCSPSRSSAECAASDPEGCAEAELLALARRAAPYSELGD